MSLTWKKTADVNTSSTMLAARQARAASSAAAANAANAAQNAALAAQNSATVAAAAATNAAQNASASLSKGVKQGVYSARSWAAPRLDSAAEYCTTTVAPKVSSALHTTARQVSPPDMKTSKRSSVLTWSLLGAAILAAVGAAAVAARYRYRSAIEADTEAADEEVLADSTDSQAAPDGPNGTRPAGDKSKDEDSETSVNGRVTATGW